MKALIVIFSFVCFWASSQSIDMYVENTNTEISGGTYSVTYQNDQQITIDLILKNNTGTNQTWDLERILPSVQHWQEQSMSWYAFSSPVNGNDFVLQQTPSWITPIDIDVPQNDSVWLSLRYQAQSEGCDLYTYYILNNDVRVDSFNIFICKTVGLDELSSDNVSLFPNPANQEVNIVFQNESPEKVKIVNQNGQIVQVLPATNEMKIATNEFPEGCYFVVWMEVKNQRKKKFLVQH